MKKILKYLLALLGGAMIVGTMNLQLFADPNTNTTDSTGIKPDVKEHYHKTLITFADAKLVHDQFGLEIPIPEHGGKSMELRYFDKLPKNLNRLIEGVTPDGEELKVNTMNVELGQYGSYVTLSDVATKVTLDPLLVQASEAMGSQAGRTLDTVTREVITAGTNVYYAPSIVDNVETEIDSRANLDMTCRLTPDLIFRVQALLEGADAETIGDSYVGIIHPYAKYDLIRTDDFIEMHKYAAVTELYKGEIGMIGNVRFVQTSEAKVVGGSQHAGEGGKNNLAVFITMILGKDAYATTYAKGLGLEHIYKPLGQGQDPLNQRCTVGWKATKAAVRIKEQNMVRIESCGKFSTTAQAN